MKKKLNKILLAISVLIVLFFVSALFLPVSRDFIKNLSSKVTMFADVLSSTLVLETNSFRSINNEANLVESPLLSEAAQMKAEDMASKGYFSHVAPNGDSPWVWFNEVGYKYSYAGENLAVDYTESADVTEGWINSAKHKANLLNTNFTEIGIGVAKGIYEGHQTIFVVQFFGKPLSKEIVKTATFENAKTLLLATANPNTAIATRADLSSGEVLGTEANNATGMNDDNQSSVLIIIGISIIVLLLIVLKIISLRGRKTYKKF